jgi:hypothetical protein
MNLDWFEKFEDPYLQKPAGQGVFLSGVLLGFVASCQGGKGSRLNDAPLFKQLPFGKLQQRDLKRHMAALPTLLTAYEIPYQRQLTEISATAVELLLQDDRPMGVDGNFIFTNAFLNAWKYLYRLYPELKKSDQPQEETP